MNIQVAWTSWLGEPSWIVLIFLLHWIMTEKINYKHVTLLKCIPQCNVLFNQVIKKLRKGWYLSSVKLKEICTECFGRKRSVVLLLHKTIWTFGAKIVTVVPMIHKSLLCVVLSACTSLFGLKKRKLQELIFLYCALYCLLDTQGSKQSSPSAFCDCLPSY